MMFNAVTRGCRKLFDRMRRNSNSNSNQPSRKIHKLTVVIDLDETLIHSKFPFFHDVSPFCSCNFKFVMLPREEVDTSEKERQVHVWVRSGAEEFLRELSKFANIIIFTASIKEYADPLISRLDPQNQYIMARFFRESLTVDPLIGNVKDLTKLQVPQLGGGGALNLKRTIIIDNSPEAFSRQPENAILVNSFFPTKVNSHREDLTFQFLLPLLRRASEVDDVRSYLADLSRTKQPKHNKARRNTDAGVQQQQQQPKKDASETTTNPSTTAVATEPSGSNKKTLQSRLSKRMSCPNLLSSLNSRRNAKYADGTATDSDSDSEDTAPANTEEGGVAAVPQPQQQQQQQLQQNQKQQWRKSIASCNPAIEMMNNKDTTKPSLQQRRQKIGPVSATTATETKPIQPQPITESPWSS